MSKPLKRPESVLVVVYTRLGDVLLLQRADDPDFWQSVTGSLDQGELPYQSAQRELQEETGIRDVPLIDCDYKNWFTIRPQWRHRYPPGTTRNLEHVFLAELNAIANITIAPAEHLSYRWVSCARAMDLLWSETNREALSQFVVPRLQ